MLGVFYRPPWNTAEDLKSLRDSILLVSRYSNPVVFTGDFNVPNIDWSTVALSSSSPNATLLCELVSDSYLTRLLTAAENSLDLVLASHPHTIPSVNVTDNCLDIIMRPFTSQYILHF